MVKVIIFVYFKGDISSSFHNQQQQQQNALASQMMSMINQLSGSSHPATTTSPPVLNHEAAAALVSQQLMSNFNVQQASNNSIMSTSTPSITSSNLSALKCSLHLTESCTSFCLLCQKMLCSECAQSSQHRQHPKASIVEAVNDARSFTENLLNESSQIIDIFKDSLHQSTQMIGKVQTKIDFVLNEITKTHINHLKALEQRKKFLVENLEKIQAIKIKSLNKQISDIKKIYTSIDELVKDVRSKIKQLPTSSNGSPSTSPTSNTPSNSSSTYQEHHIQMLFDCKQKLMKEMQTLKAFHAANFHQLLPLFQPCESDDLHYTPPDPALHNAIAQMGFLTSSAFAGN